MKKTLQKLYDPVGKKKSKLSRYSIAYQVDSNRAIVECNIVIYIKNWRLYNVRF